MDQGVCCIKWACAASSWECVHISRGHVAMVQARVAGTLMCMVSCHAVAGCMRQGGGMQNRIQCDFSAATGL